MFYSVNSFLFQSSVYNEFVRVIDIFIINFGEVVLAWNTVRVSCVRILFGYFEVFFIKALEMLSDWARVFFLSFIGIIIRSHVLLLLLCKWYFWFLFFLYMRGSVCVRGEFAVWGLSALFDWFYR